jgi:hypothetical protein
VSKPQLKFAIFLGSLALLLPAAFFAFSLLSQFITEFNRGAEPASIFHGHRLTIPEQDQVQWLPEAASYNSLLPSQAEREEIISAYWEAWQALARACQTSDPVALSTYWAGGAFRQVEPIVECADGTIFGHEEHQLELQFFSDDGSVAVLIDRQFRFTYSSAGITDSLTASAQVTMTLDVGTWRIRQIEIQVELT